MSYDEAKVRWNKWWVLLWVTIVAVLFYSAFHLPIRQWSGLAVLLFGIPELIGLRRHKDSLPPLTYVARRYVPRFLVFPLMWGFGFAATAWWLGATPGQTIIVAAMAALLGWGNDHFDVTFD